MVGGWIRLTPHGVLDLPVIVTAEDINMFSGVAGCTSFKTTFYVEWSRAAWPAERSLVRLPRPELLMHTRL